MSDIKSGIVLKNIEKKYGDVKVLDGITFEFENGKVYGLMGQNGAGKTTLMKILTGLIRQDSGAVVFDEKRTIGALIEEVGAYNHLSARENLKIFAEYIHCYDKHKIQELISVVGLKYDNKKVRNYSVGMKKRLGIAIALLNNPDILVLDEPSCGLDIDGIIATRNIVKDYMKKEGAITLISSHDTRDLVELCDVIVFLHNGKIVSCEKDFERDSLKLEKIYIELMKGEGNEIPEE